MNANSHSSFVPQIGQNLVLGANKTVQFGHFEVKRVVDSIGIVDSFVGLFTSVDIFFIIALVGEKVIIKKIIQKRQGTLHLNINTAEIR
jgi:hypothetical protein